MFSIGEIVRDTATEFVGVVKMVIETRRREYRDPIREVMVEAVGKSGDIVRHVLPEHRLVSVDGEDDRRPSSHSPPDGDQSAAWQLVRVIEQLNELQPGELQKTILSARAKSALVSRFLKVLMASESAT